jgi:DNA polymerase-1
MRTDLIKSVRILQLSSRGARWGRSAAYHEGTAIGNQLRDGRAVASKGPQPSFASAIIEKHRRAYPRFWEWRADMVQNAMLARRIESVFGWPLHLSTSPNQRTLYNFPMQSGGAEMLRLAAWQLCEAGIVPCMLVHDGILIEARNREEIAHAMEIMHTAGKDVCDGLKVGVDVDQMLEHGARYRDKRPIAQQMWQTIMAALQEIGATPNIRRAS